MNDLVSRLRALDTCAVSDALDKHGLPSAVSGLPPLAAQRAAAGRAVTVLLGPPAARPRAVTAVLALANTGSPAAAASARSRAAPSTTTPSMPRMAAARDSSPPQSAQSVRP